jgi:hypothetical protein
MANLLGTVPTPNLLKTVTYPLRSERVCKITSGVDTIAVICEYPFLVPELAFIEVFRVPAADAKMSQVSSFFVFEFASQNLIILLDRKQ